MTDDLATFDPRVRAAARAQAGPELRLTVLAHPDPSRVGRHVGLDAKTVAVGRLEPNFDDGLPLADRYLSRKPVVFSDAGALGLLVDASQTSTSVSIDGGRIGSTTLARSQLEAGVVLTLGEAVALLVHLHTPVHGARDFGLVGGSEGLQRVQRELALVADLQVPVLIRGESGVGKELVARAVHEASPRGGKPWVSVNMAAVPTQLAGSTLFGHVKGAFSGASADHDGHFVRADGGTLFMDEVGDTPPEVQVLLLRALETREIHPVGGREPFPVDVRLISATDADLEGRGDFRGPLLHRLAGFQIHVPPLRERRADIGALFVHFARAELATLGQVHRLEQPDMQDPWLPAALVAELARHDWPGNVRQLRNVTRQLVILHRDRPRLDDWASHLDRLLGGRAPTVEAPATPAPRPKYRHVDDIDDDELVATLKAHKFGLKAAAEALGVSRTALYSRVERSDRVRKASDLSAAEIAAVKSDDIGAMAAQLEVSAQALKRRMKALGLR